MGKQKFITSHAFRVKRAKEYVKGSGEKISIIDREAIVELYLLEDIKRLYEDRLRRTSSGPVNTTRAGKIANKENLRIINSTLHLLKSAIEVSKEKINNGYYSEVWRAIPEGALMRAASSVKYLDKMKVMISSLLGELSSEALRAVEQVIANNEMLDDLEAHERNVSDYRGLNMDEYEAIINSVDDVIESAEGITKPKSKPNLN